MSNKYIPTTWIGAKTVGTADVMNNIEKGIGNAHDRLDVVDEQFNTILNESIHNTISKMSEGQTVKIACCGDSITFGQTTVANTQVDISKTYPYELQRILQSIYNNSNITVLNKGNCGWSTDTWARVNGRDFKSQVLSENPDIVILMLGINDVNADLDRTIYRNNLKYLISLCKESNIEVILMSPTPTLQKTESSVSTVKQSNMQVMEYSQICKNLANNENIFFIDIQQEFLDLFYKYNVYNPLEIISSDFTHLLDYRLIANIIIKNILATSTINIDRVQKVHAVGCPYIYTNITKSNVLNYQGVSDYGSNYYIVSNTDKYIKFRFNVLRKGLNLVLKHNLSKVNGAVKVIDNGVEIKTVDMWIGHNGTGSSVMHSIGTTILNNIDIGFHEVLLDVSNFVNTGTITNPYHVVIEAFEFVENNNTILENTTLNLEPSKYNVIKLGDLNFNGNAIDINYKGNLLEGLEFNIFSAKINSTSIMYPEKLKIKNGVLCLEQYTMWQQSTPHLATNGTTTIDFNKEHNIRIIIDSNKKYTIYLNGNKEIEQVVTSLVNIKNGKLILGYNNTASSNVYLPISKVACNSII